MGPVWTAAAAVHDKWYEGGGDEAVEEEEEPRVDACVVGW